MCKMILISTFLVTMYLSSISAIQCPSCDDIIFDTTNASLTINRSICELTVESAALCRSELFVDLIDLYPAIIHYITAPSNALITDNSDSQLITTISIPLDAGYPYGSVLYDCYDQDLCNNNNSIIQKQYKQLSELNYTKLKIELTDLLYNNQSSLNENQIECYNRNNTIGKCYINGHCQATLIIERGRPDSLMTSCIPDRRPGSRTGITLQSKSIGNDYKKTSFSYTCSKNKCNDPAIVHQIRQILVKVNLVDSQANNSNFLSIILFLICIIINL